MTRQIRIDCLHFSVGSSLEDYAAYCLKMQNFLSQLQCTISFSRWKHLFQWIGCAQALLHSPHQLALLYPERRLKPTLPTWGPHGKAPQGCPSALLSLAQGRQHGA